MTLKDLRAAHQPPLTQTQLAVAAHVSLRMVQEWEAGRRSIDRASLETLCDMANALGCHLLDLIQSPVLHIKLREAISGTAATRAWTKSEVNRIYGNAVMKGSDTDDNNV